VELHDFSKHIDPLRRKVLNRSGFPGGDFD